MTRCWTITFSTKTAVVKIKEIIDLPIERRYRISCRREESPCDGQTNCRVLAFIFDLGERISAGPPGAVVQWAGGVVGPSSCPRTRNRLIIERCGFHSSFNQFGYFVYGERTDFRSTVFICHVTWSDSDLLPSWILKYFFASSLAAAASSRLHASFINLNMHIIHPTTLLRINKHCGEAGFPFNKFVYVLFPWHSLWSASFLNVEMQSRFFRCSLLSATLTSYYNLSTKI